MKKIYCCAILSLLISFSVNGQVKFDNLSYDAALRKAAKNNKLLFIVVPTPDCIICKDIANKSFSSILLGDKIKQDFIAIYLPENDIAYFRLVNNFERVNSGGILFADANGNILHKLPYSSLNVKDYITACDKAILNRSRIGDLDSLNKEYSNGNREIAFLENYISKRKEVGLETNDLLDEYASLIPKDSLISSYRINSFILDNVSIYGSKADAAWHTSKSMYKEVWYRLDRKIRSNYNKRVLKKSIAKAIREKNDTYALRVIRAFTEGNEIKKSKQALKNNLIYSADYYWAVKDISSYMYNAKKYIDEYIANITIDSVRNLDKRLLDKLNLKQDTATDSLDIPTETFAKYYSSILNKHAWNFYKSATETADLRKASYWSYKSLELNDKEGAYWDTYARLLYKLGDKKAAMDAEKNAIILIRKLDYTNTVQEFTKVLKNMESNKVDID